MEEFNKCQSATPRTDGVAHKEQQNTMSSSTVSASPPLLEPSYQQLYDYCSLLAADFRKDQTEKGQRLCAAFMAWQDFIKLANQLILSVNAFAAQYDFDEQTPGNGYRSFVSITMACINYGIDICRNVSNGRAAALFFRKKFYMKEVEACSQLLSSICTCLQYLLILHSWSAQSGDLFANGEHTAEELFERGDTINQYCFYGRCLGFQYGDSIRGVLRFISISMAGFSESFYSHAQDDSVIAKTTRSVWTSGKYFLNPELRARRIVNISQNAKIDFCKSFWFLTESELMNKVPSIVGSAIKVNRMIEIPAEPLKLPRVAHNMEKSTSSAHAQSGGLEFIDIPVPSAHLGSGKSVLVRLLSYTRRIGMLGEGAAQRVWRKLAPPSPSILFHCHGGGFVAQSSKSHELYLRDWAVALDVPILSVDYSLAPQAPYPRALEEVFYAYCWLLHNAEHLGTTAQRVVLAGDSAGANLCIGVVLKCIELGVRQPDGLFMAYCPTLISFVPSPARLLCLMDPLLPFGFMMRCLRAYAAPPTASVSASASTNTQIKHNNNQNVAKELPVMMQHHSEQEQEEEEEENLNLMSSIASSRRNSTVKSSVSSEGTENTEMQLEDREQNTASVECSSDTFASASYHSQFAEPTDLLSNADEDNSLCVSFEDDSQPIVNYANVEPMLTVITATTAATAAVVTATAAAAVTTTATITTAKYLDCFFDQYNCIDNAATEVKENGHLYTNGTAAATMGSSFHSDPPKTASEERLLTEAGRELMSLQSLHGRLNNAVNSISAALSKYTQSSVIRGGSSAPILDLRKMDALIARSPSVEFGFQVPRDPFLSPYYASDDWLKQMPDTKILTLDMDPCLDDCVMFAKKLKRLGRPVTLEILKGLPHGFLNLTKLSSAAMEGCNRCIENLSALLRIPDP